MTLSPLHLLAPSPVGGLEAVAANLAHGLHDRGHRVSVGVIVEPENRPHPFVQKLEERGVPVTPLVVPHRSYWAEVKKIRGLLSDRSPDLVHTHGYRADVVAGNVARLTASCPVVSTVHGFTGGGPKNRIYEWLQRRSLRRFDAVLAVSRPLAEDLQSVGVPEHRIRVVVNAWRPPSGLLEREPARSRLGLPAEAPVVGWVGRLSREKAPDVFLRSLARVESGIIGSIVGAGPEREALGELAEELGIENRIRFHGLVPDAAQYYRAFDAFALTSRTEGTPVSLFEAMEAEVPVIAARVGGVPDVVDDGQALMVPPENPEAVGRALESVLSDPAGAGKRVRAAKRRLRDQFSLDPWLDRYENVYRQLIEQTKAAA